MENDLMYIENFKSLLRNAMFYAQKAHDFVFDDSCENYVAGLYLNIAASKFSSAEAMYYSRIVILERGEAEEIFRLFDVFMNEFLTNIRTDHSHQWTDIEFERLKDAFDCSAFAFENR